ncbi:hypothetical protein Bpfe_022796 [Biomphalaria pfeifferi]|uniref:Uncharacterized protein n=1 Tax=Biomphalaria pfeifferi TaxID=112525 RepID=A0AAD8B498_BIOPF|nr:hypothetical protein Bpfe_022796 [Biomphalaria pfeifferi]
MPRLSSVTRANQISPTIQSATADLSIQISPQRQALYWIPNHRSVYGFFQLKFSDGNRKTKSSAHAHQKSLAARIYGQKLSINVRNGWMVSNHSR